MGSKPYDFVMRIGLFLMVVIDIAIAISVSVPFGITPVSLPICEDSS